MLFSADIYDQLISLLFFLLALFLILFLLLRKRKINLSAEYLLLFLLLTPPLFAPILTDYHPEFYKDISVTKFLPPFSYINYLQLDEGNRMTKLEELAENIEKKPFNKNVLFIDSLKINGDTVLAFQDNYATAFHLDRLKKSGSIPIIKKHFILFGTDQYGRDIFTRILYGARMSLLIGAVSVIISLILGTGSGFFAGYYKGIPDIVLSRTTDMFLSVPVIFFILIVLALFGSSLVNIILILGFTGWMSLFKIVKTEVLSVVEKDFLKTSIMLKIKKSLILKNDIFPFIAGPLLIHGVFQFANVILAESALSYLGMGPQNYVSLGIMIREGQEWLSSAWWIFLFPALFLTALLLTLNYSAGKLGVKLNPRLRDD